MLKFFAFNVSKMCWAVGIFTMKWTCCSMHCKRVTDSVFDCVVLRCIGGVRELNHDISPPSSGLTCTVSLQTHLHIQHTHHIKTKTTNNTPVWFSKTFLPKRNVVVSHFVRGEVCLKEPRNISTYWCLCLLCFSGSWEENKGRGEKTVPQEVERFVLHEKKKISNKIRENYR